MCVLCWVIVFAVSRKCVNSSNMFCYVCGEFTQKSLRISITPIVKKKYELCIGCKLGLRNNWAPQSCYSRHLHGWLIGMHQSMPSAVPVFWKGQNDHPTDFYFCLTKINGHISKVNILQFPTVFLQAYDLLNMTIPDQFPSHLNTGRCMKNNQPAPLQKTNLELHVPMWILISWKELYLILCSSLNLVIFWETSIFRKLACCLQGRNFFTTKC